MGALYSVILLLVLLLFYVYRIAISFFFFVHLNDYFLQTSFAKLVVKIYITYVYEKNYVNVDAAVDVLPKGFLYFFIAQQYNSKEVNQTMSVLK